MLSARQKLFVAEYLTDLNATRAAIASGYSAKTAHSQGPRLLEHVGIQAELAKRHGKRLDKLEITAERVLSEIAKLGFANMLDYIVVDPDGKGWDIDFSRLTREQAAAIQEITVDSTGGAGDGERRIVMRTRFKLAPKRDALELLGKHLALFTDKIQIGMDEDLVARLARGRERAAKK